MTQAEVLCLVGLCWKGFVYLWHGLTPFVLAAFPTIYQGRLTLWSIRLGYVLAIGKVLLGYWDGIWPAWVVMGAAGLCAGLYVRLERRLALRDHDVGGRSR